MKKIVILISGRGSNMEAMLAAQLPVSIAAVISNRPDAQGLETARQAGIATAVVDHKQHASRVLFEQALAQTIDGFSPDLVVLAGFIRILTPEFVTRYTGRLLNIHPSLLPSFPGLHTHQRAIDEGVRIHGCTVHFVTADLDHGPIVVQAAVAVRPDDTESSLAVRVLAEEHQIYPQAVRWFAEDRLQLIDGKVVINGAGMSGSLRVPAV